MFKYIAKLTTKLVNKISTSETIKPGKPNNEVESAIAIDHPYHATKTKSIMNKRMTCMHDYQIRMMRKKKIID